jgi:hypothetical protein
MGQLYVIELETPKPKRAIPRGLAEHRAELSGQTAQAEALRENLARMTFAARFRRVRLAARAIPGTSNRH